MEPLPTAFQPEFCSSNRLPTTLPTTIPTAFQPPSKGVCTNPPITPPGDWKPPFGALAAPRRLPGQHSCA